MVITDVNQVVYQGDGVTTAFPFTFRIIDATDIKLLLIDADGTETDIQSDYFVDTVNNTVHYPGYAPGAEPPEADQPAPVQTGQRLVIYRELPITQEKDLGDKWPFFVIELALDKLTMILQQIYGWWGRTLKFGVGWQVDHPGFDATIPVEAGKTWRVNDEGTGFVATGDPDEAVVVANNAKDVADAAALVADGAALVADGAKTTAQNAKDVAQDAKDVAQGAALVAAGAKTTAQNAKAVADDAKDVAARAKTTAEGIAGTAQEAKDIAQNAKAVADDAKDVAAGAKTTAQNAKDVAQDAKDVADDAALVAAGAKTTAQDAKAVADDAKDVADGAKTTAEGIAGTVQNAKDIAVGAKTTAEGIAATAQDAKDIAQNAKAVADDAKDVAARAKTTAEGIAGTAQEAKDIAQEAKDIAQDAKDITVDDELSDTSTNPVQNKVVKMNLDALANRLGADYAKKTDLDDYLPLSGGTLTGDLDAKSAITCKSVTSSRVNVRSGRVAPVNTLQRYMEYSVDDIVYTSVLNAKYYLLCVTAGKTSATMPSFRGAESNTEVTDGTVVWRVQTITSQESVETRISKSGLPVGFEAFTTNPTLQAGWLPLLGGEYSRETYADLWAWVQTQNGYLLEESAWQAKAAANGGNVPFYSKGDGSTTFRVPALKCWVKGARNISEVGGYLAAGLPNITGTLLGSGSYSINNATYFTGAFAYTNAVTSKTYGTDERNEKWNSGADFKASRCSSIYGNSDTVQPESIVGMWVVKAYGTVTNVGSTDVANISAGLTQAETRISTAETRISALENHGVSAGATVVKTYRNGTEWYRVWSDGWVEQGGQLHWKETSDPGLQTVTLYKAMADTKYNTHIETLRSTGGTFGTSCSDHTTTAFSAWTYAHDSKYDKSVGLIWFACGQGA